MSDRNFRDALKEADQAHQSHSLSPDADRRIRARAEVAFDRRGRFAFPTWGLGLAGAVAAAALVVYALSRPPEHAAEVNGFVAEKGMHADDVLLAKGNGVVATARAEIADPASRIHVVALRGATLERDPRGIRVVSGTVEVSVEKRHAGEAPAVVFVSGGAIEILGTRFTIVQGEQGAGEVALHEGRIQFRAADGRLVTLSPGESLKWPLAPEVALAPASPMIPGPPVGAVGGSGPIADATAEAKSDDLGSAPSAPIAHRPAIASTTPHKARPSELKPTPVPGSPQVAAPAPAPAFDVDALIEEINVLRRRGQFGDAASRLEGALQGPLPEATSERLSYELGSILTWQLKDPVRGCEVWKAHRAAHPTGRYAAEVQRAEASLGCK